MHKWTEGHIHVAMRKILKAKGWLLIAGEYPGGSDHELYPLNVIDPTVARDRSPDPRRHSLGELIPDLVALRGRDLLIAEAKVAYNIPDLEKLKYLINQRNADLMTALAKFSNERSFPIILPLSTLMLRPTLVYLERGTVREPEPNFTHLLVSTQNTGRFVGALAD